MIHGFRWIAELLGLLGFRLAGRSVWLLGFVVRRLEPWSLTRSTLGEVGGYYFRLINGLIGSFLAFSRLVAPAPLGHEPRAE